MNTHRAATEPVAFEPVNRELDLSLGQRLGIGFGLLLTVLAVFTGLTVHWHSRSAAAQREYTERIAPLRERADELERATLYVGLTLRSYLLVPEARHLTAFQRSTERAEQALGALAATPKEADGDAEFTEISAATRTYVEAAERLASLRPQGPATPADEVALVELRERALEALHELLETQVARTQDALAEMANARDKISDGLFLLTALGAILCVAIAYLTTQSIRRPTRGLVRVAEALEAGDWKPALELAPSSGDTAPLRSEMRILARAIGSAAASLEQRERELRERNDRIQAQNEELQAQNEEIQSQAEELQTQAEELQSQGEELHAQNEELTQQSHELRVRTDELIEANERKNHFLGVLAHELRNPLAPISNSIFILKRVDAASEAALRARAVIERQTRHMIRLIDDLLDITRISQGKIRVQSEPLDLVATVRACLEDQSGAVGQAGLTLLQDLPDNIIPVRGDYTRLCQVVGNLLSNAIKFTDDGGSVRVTLREDGNARQAVLEVLDTGIGMDGALLPLLFQPFRQGANGFSRTNSGLGLGLALVKALVELHGGVVSAYSEGASKGSRFVVRLPLDVQAIANG